MLPWNNIQRPNKTHYSKTWGIHNTNTHHNCLPTLIHHQKNYTTNKKWGTNWKLWHPIPHNMYHNRKQMEQKKHKLTPHQQANKQKILYKLYTFNIYILEDLTMTTSTTLMNLNKFKKQYNSCPTIIKIVLHHYQIMFCQYNTCETNCP